MVQLPPPLLQGDIIRIVAPSGVFDRTVFAAGVALLESQGFVPRFDPDLFACDRYFAGSDARRLRELRTALADPDAKAIWAARGGYGATRLLPQLSEAEVRLANKWWVGFSDASAVHALWFRAGVASVHGANVTTLPAWSDAARTELFGLVRGAHAQSFSGEVQRVGPRVVGPVVGGNLTVLAAMAGTGTLPANRGAIVFLEDVGERPYRLDRSVTQLVQAGFFAGAVGVVLGQLTECEEPPQRALPGVTALSAIVETLAPLGVPILAGLPLGHASSSRAIMLGRPYCLDTTRAELRVELETSAR